MPIYEYKCTDCGAHLEKIQKATDAPLTTCEKCGGNLEKQWSLSGFQFKGEGWYVTDYAGKKNGGSSDDAKPASGESTDSAKPASESKTAKDTSGDKPDKKKKD